MDKQQEIDCLRAKCQRHQEEHEKACEKMAKQNMVTNELKQELESLRQEKFDAIQKMRNSMLNVQQVYSGRFKELEKGIKLLRGW